MNPKRKKEKKKEYKTQKCGIQNVIRISIISDEHFSNNARQTQFVKPVLHQW